MARLLKFLRVLRIIRLLRFFKELRLILGGVMSSFKSVMWSILLVVVVTYMFSICFVQAMTGKCRPGVCQAHGTMPGYGDVISAMVTLLAVGTGGIDWLEPFNVLDHSSLYQGVFVFYVIFFVFVIHNTVTSLFVEGLLDKQANDEQLIMQERIEKKADYVKKIESLFDVLDNDGNGLVSYQELLASLDDPRMILFASSLDMEESDLRVLLDVLTGSGRTEVDIESFVVGCIKLRGQARTVDLLTLGEKLKRAMRDDDSFRKQMLGEIRAVKHAVEENFGVARKQLSVAGAQVRRSKGEREPLGERRSPKRAS